MLLDSKATKPWFRNARFRGSRNTVASVSIAQSPFWFLCSLPCPPSPFKSSIDTSRSARALRKHLPGIASAADVQLVHLVLEGCSFQSEALCRPAPAGYPARRAFQRIDNDVTFSLLECGWGWGRGAPQFCAWDIQLVPSRENHATFDKVFQLANVAWPLSVHQRLHGLLWHKLNPLLHLARVAQNKMMHQHRNVFTPFAKRRNLNWENIQAVKEVFAELTVANHALQIAVRCGNQTNVYTNRFRTSQAFKFAFLQSAQQLWLQLETNIANFI